MSGATCTVSHAQYTMHSVWSRALYVYTVRRLCQSRLVYSSTYFELSIYVREFYSRRQTRRSLNSMTQAQLPLNAALEHALLTTTSERLARGQHSLNHHKKLVSRPVAHAAILLSLPNVDT